MDRISWFRRYSNLASFSAEASLIFSSVRRRFSPASPHARCAALLEPILIAGVAAVLKKAPRSRWIPGRNWIMQSRICKIEYFFFIYIPFRCSHIASHVYFNVLYGVTAHKFIIINFERSYILSIIFTALLSISVVYLSSNDMMEINELIVNTPGFLLR